MHYSFMHSHTPHTNTASTLLTATSGESSRESSLWLDREASKSAEVVSKSAKGIELSDRACSTDSEV